MFESAVAERPLKVAGGLDARAGFESDDLIAERRLLTVKVWVRRRGMNAPATCLQSFREVRSKLTRITLTLGDGSLGSDDERWCYLS